MTMSESSQGTRRRLGTLCHLPGTDRTLFPTQPGSPCGPPGQLPGVNGNVCEALGAGFLGAEHLLWPGSGGMGRTGQGWPSELEKEAGRLIDE